MSGLNFDDAFDRIFSRAFGCLSQAMIKDRMDAGLTPLRCIFTESAFQRIILEKAAGTPVQDYLRSKGGVCTELVGGTWRCTVERDITTTGYAGDTPGRRTRTRFTLRVDIRGHDGEIQTNIERDDFVPAAR